LTIQVDTREHKREWERIKSQFDSLGVDYFRSKLWVGDYMNIDRPRIVVDRKKDLLELCGNITQQHERFQKELLRAQDKDIKLIILCEHGNGIERLSDIHFWHNPRLDVGEWIMLDGHPYKKPKYPKATDGPALYKSLATIRDKYGVDIQFCDQGNTGYVLTQILGG
jgi:hypothetical protein